MMNILNEIAEKTRERIEKDKKEMPREDLIREIQQKKVQMLLNPLIQSETAKTPHSFYQALKKPGMSYICEVKKADRKSTRLNSSHSAKSRMPSSA